MPIGGSRNYICYAICHLRGTIAGRETTNPIILSIIPGTNFNKKIELCRFAFTIIVKTLAELRSSLRGMSFDKE
ncbi:hypothetical protein pdam_00022211, partial [Pocillopora damicornis]